MNIKSIRNIIENTNGRIFRATFLKKDNTERVMVCRLGVTKGLKGGESTLKGKEHLMAVWDCQARGYRSINLETLISAKIDGVTMDFQKETV